MRAVQYASCFKASTRWEAEFVSRQPEQLSRVVNWTDKPHIPVISPLLNCSARAYQAYWERQQEDKIVRMAPKFDLIYLVKIPYLPIYRRLKELGGPKVVMEMNDGLWLPFFRKNWWIDLDEIIAESDAVVCENGHLAQYVRSHNLRVYVVPDSPQLPVFDLLRSKVQRNPDRTVLGWIGSRENAGSLYRILEPLEELSIRHSNLHLRVVGADASFLPRFENVRCTSLLKYDQETMVREALKFDIGLFPMYHNGDALSRGTLKAMIYMSAEAAVVAERVGENPNLIRDRVNGLLADTANEWYDKLEFLISDVEGRREIARNGLNTIRSDFAASVVFDRLIDTFDAIVQTQ